MTWADRYVSDHFFGDDDRFLDRYCSPVTRKRLGSLDVALLRNVLRRLAKALPNAAHTTPTWNGEPNCIVAVARPQFQKRGDGLTVVLKKPYIGLCNEGGALYIWADPSSAAASGAHCWQKWRDGPGGVRRRFPVALTMEDATGAGKPLQNMLSELQGRISGTSSVDAGKADVIEQARADLEELAGLPLDTDGKGREFFDVIYPRLAARLSGRPEEEGGPSSDASVG